MRGFLQACFFGLLIAAVFWYGANDSRDLLVRSTQQVYAATRIDRAVAFTHDHVVNPVRRFFDATDRETTSELHAGLESVEVVSGRGVRATVAGIGEGIVAWVKDVVGNAAGQAKGNADGAAGTTGTASASNPPTSPHSNR
jgi:hypothetical protein